MIPKSTIDKIIDRADIVDVVSDYVSLKKSGSSYKGLCPFHDDTSPSFYVSPSRGICKCFSCGKAGNAVHFIMEIEQLDFIGAIRFLGKRYGIEIEETELTDEQRQQQSKKESMYALNEWTCTFFQDTLNTTEEGQNIGQSYFRSRGIREDIIQKFRLGYAQKGFDNLSKAALKAGFNEEYLTEVGLAFKRQNNTLGDIFYERVMFPWLDVSGKVVGFGGRVLDSRTKGVNRKYVNSPDSDIYHKGSQLYGIYQAKKAINKEDRVYIVEGYTDVISMHQCGIENVVANSGTSLSYEQIQLLKRFTQNVTLLYDGDKAGIHAALRGTDMLLEKNMHVKILLLPDGDDPDSFARKKSATEFKEYVEQNQCDFITFKTNLLIEETKTDPTQRIDLINNIVTSIACIPEEINRNVYIQHCSAKLSTDEDILRRAVSKERAARRDAQREEKERNEQRTQRLEQNQTVQEVEVKVQEKKEVVVENHLVGLEKLILSMILKHGEETIHYTDLNGEEADTSLVDYVVQELAVDDLQFQDELHGKILKLAYDYTQTPHEKSLDKWMITYPNLTISKVAVDLDERGGTQGPSVDISEQIIRLMLDYKYEIVRDLIKTTQARMCEPALSPEENQRLLSEFMNYSQLQRQLAKTLGDRVIG